MTAIPLRIEDAILTITQEIRVKAPIAITFAALLDQLGSGNEKPDGTPIPMTLEAFPGGRWFRDLGDGDGHFWGNVQAIKSPSLLEISGPLFMSAPVANNVQYRLTEQDGETVIQFRHTGFGLLPKDMPQTLTRAGHTSTNRFASMPNPAERNATHTQNGENDVHRSRVMRRI